MFKLIFSPIFRLAFRSIFKSILIFFICISSANAITLAQTIASDVLFDLTLVAPIDAGDYFDDSYTRDNTQLTIDDVTDDTEWKIYAKLSNFVHSGQEKIRVQIKRQGDGTGVTLPSAGNTYKTLNETSYTYIFRGKGKRFDIPMQTKIKGIGVSDDYGTFNTTIEYKVETY